MAKKVLLEHDEKSGYALVLRRLEKRNEYVVAYGYNAADGDWSQGHYHDSIESAVVDYNRCIDGVSIEIAPADCFCAVRWCDEDVESFLLDRYGAEYATKENVARCKDMMRGGETLDDRLTEEGWEVMEACVDAARLVRRGE